MKQLVTVILASAVLSSVAQAAAISIANGGSRGHVFYLANGTDKAPATTTTVSIGFYANPADMSSAFTEFGTTTMGSVNATFPNGFLTAVTVANSTVAGNTQFASKQLAIKVTAASGEMGVFTSPTWTTAANFNAADATFNLTVGTASPTPALAVTALMGSYRVDNLTLGTGSNAQASIYTLAAVPEPGVSILALASLGLLARRDRKSVV